jgi:hypothetical protein
VSFVWNLVLLSVDIEFPEAGSFRLESSRGAAGLILKPVLIMRGREMKSAAMACDLIVAFVV